MNIRFILSLLVLFGATALQAQQEMSLAGSWRFQLDAENKGIVNGWQTTKLAQSIALPGTTDEAGYGEKTSGSDFGILTRAYKYYGPAWYQRDIVIPEEWKGKRIFLELERVLWESKTFIDGKEIATCDALNSSHWHDLGFLLPGTHQLTVRINNDMIYNIGDKGHVYSEYTQSIWNGAVGRIRLVAKEKVRLQNPEIFTGINPCSFRLTDTIQNEYTKKQTATVRYQLYDRATGALEFTKDEQLILLPGATSLDFKTSLPQSIKLWDDMFPNLYTLRVSLLQKGKEIDTKEIELGFREVTASESKMLINGKPVFLRGNLDCVHFPLTGYPSCKVEDWERIFRIYKEYGLNHVRFHSWCPPEAAFIAANRIGIYIQSETIWIDWWMSAPADRKEMDTKGYPQGLGKNPSADNYVQQELSRMVKAYGNNPSFVMMCIGNELGNSDFEVMQSWMKPYKENDSRRLYATSTARKIMPVDQYMATHHIDKLGATRGLKGGASTDWDFEEVYSKTDIPVLSHEIGQWPVYPRWDEIKKYKGVLKARNFEEFRQQARINKIEEQNDDFVSASGALNQIMYKYEIESFLRTPSCAGIQLLSLQDYQGQGEALIGWLDVFYDSKGITTPDKFRAHHDTTVPLLRIPKFVWKSNETLSARIQLAHYGSEDLSDAMYWKIKDDANNVLSSGKINKQTYMRGSSAIAGAINVSLAPVKQAGKYTIEIGLETYPVKNTWNIWIYPAELPVCPGTVYVTDRFDANCRKQLEAGASVLLDASALGTEHTADKISFYPLYWSLTFFPGQGKNTIGMLVKDKHPLFANFPTEAHSDWQWQSVYKNARAFYINDYPENYKPIAQPVDDFHRNNKLASIFELKVGKGKLLVSGFNLLVNESDSLVNANPVARQLKSSILQYMNSPAFNPVYEKDAATLSETFALIEPVKREVPAEFSNALLYIESGAKQQQSDESKPWSLTSDKCDAQKKTTYQVVCDGTWKDKTSTAWHGKEMELTIKCPDGIIGSLYVFFHDWNSQGREGAIVFEGRSYTLGKHDKEGVWIKLHVMREDSNDGTLILKAKAEKGGNLMISKVVLTEE